VRRGRGHVSTSRQPGNQRPGFCQVTLLLQVEDRLNDTHEILRRLATGQCGQILIEPLSHFVIKTIGVFVLSGFNQGVFNLTDPAVQNVAESPAGAGRRAQFGHYFAVNIVETMKPQVVVRNDDEAGHEVFRLCIEQSQPGHECLAATIAASQELDGAFAGPRQFELSFQLSALLFNSDGERVDSTLGHESFSERLEDVVAITRCQRAHGAVSFPFTRCPLFRLFA